MGSAWATNTGFAAKKTIFWHLVIASLMVSATVSMVGMIGFVGLVVPHTVRLLFGMRSHLLVLASVLSGWHLYHVS